MTRASLVAELASLVGGSVQATWLIDAVVGPGAGAEEIVAAAPILREKAAAVASGYPLQYACGSWGFRHLDLLVDERALIPRPETEQMVEYAIAAASTLDRPLIAVDLGTGSGAIACALATEIGGVTVHAVDASPEALSLAKRNAERTGSAVEFHLGSWWEPLPDVLHGAVNLLVSNPPYVTDAEYGTLDRALYAEPRTALVAGPSRAGHDGLGDLECIIDGAPAFLAPRAVVVLECAPHQCDDLAELARSLGTVEIVQDLAGKNRGVVIRCPD